MSQFLSYAGLVESDLECLSSEVKEKLEIAFDSLSHESAECRSKLEEAYTSHERNMNDLRTQLKDAEDGCKAMTARTTDLEKLLNDTNLKLSESYGDKLKIQEKLDELCAINFEISSALRHAENEKDILSAQLKQKILTIEEISVEVNQLKSEAESVRKLKLETMCRMEELESRESSQKTQESRRAEELSGLQRHIQWLEERLRQTTDQLLTVRRDTSQKVYTLEAELELRKTEVDNAKRNSENLHESINKLTKANEDYIEKLKQVAEEQIRMEQLYCNELDAQKHLVALYKDQITDAEKKNEELTEAAANMQCMLKAAYENTTRLESEKTFLEQQFADQRSQFEEKLKGLCDELDRSRQLLEKFRIDGLSEEELRQINPAVAATLSALKRGHSLTQLYSEYVQVVEDRDQLKLDKERLTEYVKELVDEVKEKAPLLKEQQNTYRRMKANLQETTVKLQSTEDKLKECENHRQELQRRAGYFQRESGRWKQTCTDLSKQVQVLLRELEVSRGVVIEDPETASFHSPESSEAKSGSLQPLPDSSTPCSSDLKKFFETVESSAAAVIDEHLVTWRSLQELQSQNQRLLCVSRDLATQFELKEAQELETSKRISNLSVRLETAMGELDVVRMTAREARGEIRVLTRQRDAYRALLEQHDIELAEDVNISESENVNSEMEESALTPAREASWKERRKSQQAALQSATVEKLEQTLNSIESEFKRYREDKAESDKVYTNTIDELRKEANEARLLNQKLAAQLDFTHEKLRTMETNISGYKEEITVLREMNARYSTSAASSEAEQARLRDELIRTSDRLLEIEVDARHSARQLEIARANETRFRQEIDSLHRQEQLHTQLMYQLQAIQGSLEEREATDRKSSEKRVVQLEKELSESQSAFTEASAALKSRIETLEHELAVARQSLGSRDEEVNRLQSELTSKENQLLSLRPQKATGGVTDDDESVNEIERLRDALARQAELQGEVDGLNARLQSVRKHADQMRELAEEAEGRLKTLSDENIQLEDRLRSELKEAKQRSEFLESQLDLEKKERQNLVSENIRITEEAHQMNAELHRELTNLQSELESTKARCEDALKLEAGAKAAIEEHERLSQEARTKYERELAMHAEDVEALTEARRQANEALAKYNELQEKFSAAESRAESASKEISAANTIWEEEREQLKKNLSDSEKEHNLMQEQILKLTQQIVGLRKLLDKSGTDTDQPSTSTDAESTSMEDLKTSEDLLHLISYLRRQKSVAEATCDASSAEISRLLLRISNLENQKASLMQELEKERKASELALETNQRHSQLMERVEQLNLVTESNRLLRREREALQANLDASNKQIRDLEALVGPLRERSNELAGQLESMSSERRSLEEERNRWKERCNRLVETAQRMDPEQYRLACNERDELQRKLRRAEEDIQQYIAKQTELQTDSENRIQKLNSELEEALSSKAEAETACSEQRTAYESLQRDLENKVTTIAKLRELGRKYRQESETLRHQLSATRSDETQLQSLNESLTETRADLVTVKADLAASRTECSQLAFRIEESVNLLLSYKSRTLANVSAGPSTIDAHRLPECLGEILEATTSELTRLNQQAEEQRERLLRTQLIESQLTKSQRECTELRARVAELQSSTPLQTTSLPLVSVQTETDFGDSQQVGTSHTGRHTVMVSGQTLSDPTISTEVSSFGSGQSIESGPISQPVSPWIMRAAATVQPVQPTPSLTPPNSVKQTAEIRPITSNVATVMPTPASQIAQTTAVAFVSESVLVPPIPVSTAFPSTEAVPIVVSSISSIPQAQDFIVSRPETNTANVVWPSPRRVTQSQIMDFPAVGPSTSQSTFPRSPTTMASVTGKRRHEEICGSSGSPSTSVSFDQPTLIPTQTDTSASVTIAQTVAQSFPDVKRFRQQILQMHELAEHSQPEAAIEPSLSSDTAVQEEVDIGPREASSSGEDALLTGTEPYPVVQSYQLPTVSTTVADNPPSETGSHQIRSVDDVPAIPVEVCSSISAPIPSNTEPLLTEASSDRLVMGDTVQTEYTNIGEETSQSSALMESEGIAFTGQQQEPSMFEPYPGYSELDEPEAIQGEPEEESGDVEEDDVGEASEHSSASDRENAPSADECSNLSGAADESSGSAIGEDVIELSSVSDGDGDQALEHEEALGEESTHEDEYAEYSEEDAPSEEDTVGDDLNEPVESPVQGDSAASNQSDDTEEAPSANVPSTASAGSTISGVSSGAPLFGSTSTALPFGSTTPFTGPTAGLFSNIESKAPAGLFSSPRFPSATFSTTTEKPSASEASSLFSGSSGLFKPFATTTAPASTGIASSLFSSGLTSTDKTQPSETVSKPKIQPIVWDSPHFPSTPATPSTTTLMASRGGVARRKKWGAPLKHRAGPYATHSTTPGNPPVPETFGSSRGGHSGPGGMRPGPRRN